MYNVKWDEEINGILFTDMETDLVPPRPVFFQELDLLGFNKYWTYPRSKKPLLWAVGRRYFYKGNTIASTKKGDALNLPEIVFQEGYESIELEEIDIEEVVNRNKDALFVIENNAIDFIEDIYTKYPDFPLSVSFSGGKDSQAVLDLVTRTIHSEKITIIFSDTTLEHDYTYSTVDETIKLYKDKFPGIKFEMAKPVKSSSELFEDMGLPSRFNRWCTPALKTAPFNNLINNIVDPAEKLIVFEGVRREESPRRSKYKQIADSVTHHSVINARPILNWNFTEVILYNYYRDLPLNPLYKFGFSRVGCMLCPFSSEWSECLHAHLDDKFDNEYIPLIKDYARNRGLSNEKDLDKFVSEGQWKKRAGGKGLTSESAINFSQTFKSFKSVSIKPTSSFLQWIKILGDVSYHEKNNLIKGELNLDGKFVSFTIKKNNDKEIIEFFDIQNDVKLQSKLKKILNKSTYCVGCGVCDIECNQGALKTNPKASVDSTLCDNCGNCIEFVAHGCLRAKSLYDSVGGKTMTKRTSGIDKYSTFGLREEWLEEFIEYGDEWLENNSLGPKQIPAITNWLTEANLIERKTNKTTKLGSELKILFKNDPDFVWGVIWINLYHDSKIVGWYCDNIEWGNNIAREDLLERLMDSYPDLSKGTLNNALSALINTFDNSPLNDLFGLGHLTKKGRAVKFIDKNGVDDELDKWLVAYSLYKLKEIKSRKDFTVTELYDENFEGGPYKIFGISESQLERILRGLQQSQDKIINVNLAADLDNLFLKDEIDTEDIIALKKQDI